MKIVSEKFLERMQSNLRTFVPRMTIAGVELDGDIQTGLSVTMGSCGTERFSFGVCFVPTLTAALTGCNTKVRDKEILLEMGLVLDDGTVEYKKIGYFTPERPITDKFQTSFTAYGRLASKANGLYVSKLDYPATITSVLEEIETQTGLRIILNGFVAEGILDKPISGELHREALMHIAGLFGGFVTENGEGNIVISKYELNKAVTVNTDLCYSWPETNDEEYEVTGIEVVVSDGGIDDEEKIIESVKFSAGEVNVVSQNPYMDEDLFELCKLNVVGFSYMPARVEFLGDVRLEPWDSIVLTDEDQDDGIDIPCMNISHVWDGGLVTTITAPGETATEFSEPSGGPMQTLIDRTYKELLLAKEIISKKVSAEYVKTHYASIEELDAATARIKNLETDMLTAEAVNAKVAELVDASIEKLDTKYAKIDRTNIDEAWIKELLVQGNILTNEFTAGTGAFTKYLTGVKVHGDLVEADTLKAKVLILQGVDGIYRRLNIDALGEAVVEKDEKYDNALDGAVLVKESITADRINFTSLFGQDITTTGDFNLGGTGALVYNKETDVISITGNRLIVKSDNLDIDADGTITGRQFVFGGEKEYISYLKDEEGTYRLSTNFMESTDEGIVFGDMTEGELQGNLLVASDGVGIDIRNGEIVLASFADDLIELGKNSKSATIDLCDGSGEITASDEVNYGNKALLISSENLRFLAGHTAITATSQAYNPEESGWNAATAFMKLDGYHSLENDQKSGRASLEAACTEVGQLSTIEAFTSNYDSPSIQFFVSDGGIYNRVYINADSVEIPSDILMNNGKFIYGKFVDGTACNLMWTNASDQMGFGYGSYSLGKGSVYIDGNILYLRSNSGVYANGVQVSTSNHTHSTLTNNGHSLLQANNGNVYSQATSGTAQLGVSTRRWLTVWSQNALNTTSDIRLKENFDYDMSKYIAMMDRIKPMSFTWKSDADDPDAKRHIAYGAQYVWKAMKDVGLEEKDFAGLIKEQQEDGPAYTYSLCKEEFIPILQARQDRDKAELLERIERIEKVLGIIA